MMNNKTIAYYLDLPYTIEFQQDKSDPQNPVWFAKVKELPGCMTEADTLEEASRMIQDAFESIHQCRVEPCYWRALELVSLN